MRAPACPADRAHSCRRPLSSHPARRSCRRDSWRYPGLGAQSALAGIDQMYDAERLGQRAGRARATHRRDMHVAIGLVALAGDLRRLAVDRKTAADEIGLDGVVVDVDANAADALAVEIVHVDVDRWRPLHIEQQVEVVVDVD